MYPVWWGLTWSHWLQQVFVFAEALICCSAVAQIWGTTSQSREYPLCLTVACNFQCMGSVGTIEREHNFEEISFSLLAVEKVWSTSTLAMLYCRYLVHKLALFDFAVMERSPETPLFWGRCTTLAYSCTETPKSW